MSRLLLIFDEPAPLIAAARHLREGGVRGMDAHVPYRIPELDDALDLPASPVRLVMLLAAVAVGGATWILQWATAVRLYPFNSGGRPDNSWPIFTFAVFEMGVLAAAFAGLVAMFVCCGLPRLHHPFFASARTERASDDRFYLSLPVGTDTPDRRALSGLPGLRELLEVEQ
ncbi:MAG: DUF3341 domain-containing protein [Rhodobacterales bacterium]|nr:DUF3341 domain-containing protein [Rhodobacterales bacterium]